MNPHRSAILRSITNTGLDLNVAHKVDEKGKLKVAHHVEVAEVVVEVEETPVEEKAKKPRKVKEPVEVVLPPGVSVEEAQEALAELAKHEELDVTTPMVSEAVLTE